MREVLHKISFNVVNNELEWNNHQKIIIPRQELTHKKKSEAKQSKCREMSKKMRKEQQKRAELNIKIVKENNKVCVLFVARHLKTSRC